MLYPVSLVICLILVLFLIPLQFMYLFCNLSKCILLFFSCISALLLLFFWCPLSRFRLKYHENLSTGSPDVPCGRADMTKLIATLLNSTDAPKTWTAFRYRTWHLGTLRDTNADTVAGCAPTKALIWFCQALSTIFPGVRAALPPSCADCLENWEPQLPGTLWACPGL